MDVCISLLMRRSADSLAVSRTYIHTTKYGVQKISVIWQQQNISRTDKSSLKEQGGTMQCMRQVQQWVIHAGSLGLFLRPLKLSSWYSFALWGVDMSLLVLSIIHSLIRAGYDDDEILRSSAGMTSGFMHLLFFLEPLELRRVARLWHGHLEGWNRILIVHT